MSFEYLVLARPLTADKASGNVRASGDELVEWLNSLGASGWELSAVREDEYGWSEFMFKREVA